jgi:hypothetical protein
LPLVEGEYAVGIFIHCGDLRGDVYELSRLAVVSAPQRNGVPPYAPHDRGLLELSYDVLGS